MRAGWLFRSHDPSEIGRFKKVKGLRELCLVRDCVCDLKEQFSVSW